MPHRRVVPALCCVLFAAACGGVGGGGADSEPAVTTMGFAIPDEHASARVDVFKKANPNVRVQINEGGFDEQQFLSAVASGSPPDIVYVDRDKLGTYAVSGAIQPMDDCVRDQHVDMGQFRPAAVDQVTYNGRVFGLPDFSMVRVLIASTSALRDAGLAPADLSTSDWNTLEATAGRLVKLSGGRPARIGFDPEDPGVPAAVGEGERRGPAEPRRPDGAAG